MSIKRWLACVFTVIFFITTQLYCAPISKGDVSRTASYHFTQAAKKATPAVVSIRSTLSVKKQNPSYGNPYDEQGDPFQDEFWRRIFGVPMPQQKSDKKPTAISQGSGFIVSSDGKILTNNHVIQDADKIVVIFSDGKEYPATVIGKDPNTDIALLQIDAKDLPFLVLADSDELEIGEWVIACGNLLGFQTSITVGVVSAKGRNDLDVIPVEEFIQTDAAINHGNSGGPLLNLDAEVVGMNTAFATNTGGYLGLGFAIPSNIIKHIMNELLTHGKVIRGFIGVVMQKIDSDLAHAFNLSKAEGALITDVTKDGPADKAGVKPGDIVLKVNTQPIGNIGSLRNFISLMHPGDTVTLLIRRNDKDVSLQATVGTHPESELAISDAKNDTGILVEPLTPELATKYGYTDDTGVFIKYVEPSSLAFEAGIRPGQLIVSVNRIPVTTPDQFYKAVKDTAGRKQALLYIKAGQMVRFVSLKFE